MTTATTGIPRIDGILANLALLQRQQAKRRGLAVPTVALAFGWTEEVTYKVFRSEAGVRHSRRRLSIPMTALLRVEKRIEALLAEKTFCTARKARLAEWWDAERRAGR